MNYGQYYIKVFKSAGSLGLIWTLKLLKVKSSNFFYE